MTDAEANLSTLTRRRFLRDSAVLGAGAYLSGAASASARLLEGGTGRSVAVIGGGIAGLTAAHELAERGFEVTVYEPKAFGGKARSMGVPGTATQDRLELPAEHGFRAVFGFYQNLPDTMRRIPFGSSPDGVYGNLVPVGHAQLARHGGPDLTIPIDYGAFDPRNTTFQIVWESIQASLLAARNIPPHEVAFFAKQVAMFFTSCEARRFGQWEYENWWDYTRAEHMSEEYRKQFADGLTRNLAAAKPKDMSVNSTGIVGESFAYSLSHRPDDPDGAPDRVLNAPTNEAWIDPWTAELERLGVALRLGETVERIKLKNGRVASLNVRGTDGSVRADRPDWVICGVPVERAIGLFTGDVVAADPSLESLGRLRTEWMNGVIFHLDREVPVCDGHVNYIDSPFALTSISQAGHWDRDIARQYGDGVARESFSTIISDFSTPGMLYGKPAWALTPEQICDEVWAQLKAHLNDTDARLDDSWVVSRFVDPAISYPPELVGRDRIAANDEPLLINTPGSWDDRPEPVTAVPNLMLAGSYVRTSMNVETMESACESGRLAADSIVKASGAPAEPVQLFDRWVPPENESLKRIDDQRYRLGLPHVLDTPWVDL